MLGYCHAIIYREHDNENEEHYIVLECDVNQFGSKLPCESLPYDWLKDYVRESLEDDMPDIIYESQVSENEFFEFYCMINIKDTSSMTNNGVEYDSYVEYNDSKIRTFKLEEFKGGFCYSAWDIAEWIIQTTNPEKDKKNIYKDLVVEGYRKHEVPIEELKESSLYAEGNNSGNYVRMEKFLCTNDNENIILMEIGDCCVVTVKTLIPVTLFTEYMTQLFYHKSEEELKNMIEFNGKYKEELKANFIRNFNDFERIHEWKKM